MRTAALIPTLYRPQGLTLALQSLTYTAPEVMPVIAREWDDFEAQSIGDRYGAIMALCELERAGCAYAWNVALKAAPDYDAYVIASDDMEFLDGWYDIVQSYLQKLGGSGLVGMNAGWKKSDYSFFYLMTRDFMVEHHGGVAAVPLYQFWGVDTEACERAMRQGKYVKTKEIVCRHHREKELPPVEKREAVKQIYNQRVKQGFPDNFERILCE